MRKVDFASFIGTAIDFYDFYIYGTAAALGLGGAFFPGFDETAGTLAAFATFAVGFAARPLGGMVFGRFGTASGARPCLSSRSWSSASRRFASGFSPARRR